LPRSTRTWPWGLLLFFVWVFFASPAFAKTPPPPDIYDVPTYPQLNDPEVLEALPHLGAEVSSLDWFAFAAGRALDRRAATGGGASRAR